MKCDHAVHLEKGRFAARIARSTDDLQAAADLRFRAFRGIGAKKGRDQDRFDSICTHILVEDTANGRLACCFRLLLLNSGQQIDRTYSAQFYDLKGLAGFQGKLVELGRFCVDPKFARDPDVLRVAWGSITQFVDAENVELLFGCSSFSGVKTAPYLNAMALLRDRYVAPNQWRPGALADQVFRFKDIEPQETDLKRAMLTMPPLLRTYLLMGGWVSDHAVIDTELNTMHVFTGVEIAKIPANRARLLRNVAEQKGAA